eukprot:1037547-Amphidinium_carterae.1
MAEVEKLKSALADVIKKARNKDVSLNNTAWTQRPPNGLKEFIDQVAASEAEDVKRPFLRVAAAVPTTPVRSTTHPVDESSFLASGDRSGDRGASKT